MAEAKKYNDNKNCFSGKYKLDIGKDIRIMFSDLRCAADQDSVNDCPGCINSKAKHFFCYMYRSIKSDQGERGLEKSQDPGHTVGPTSLIVELCEDELSVGLRGGKLVHFILFIDLRFLAGLVCIYQRARLVLG